MTMHVLSFSSVSLQGFNAIEGTTSSYAQVCATVRESVDLLAVAAAGAIRVFSSREGDSISAALAVGEDSASRCFAMLNRFLAAAGQFNDHDTGITGIWFLNLFACIKS
jgi:DhnA family fructose-bisphosphate aldolase class Ia